MRCDQPDDRARTARLTRRRLIFSGAVAAAAVTVVAACGDDKVEHGKFKLRSGASW